MRSQVAGTAHRGEAFQRWRSGQQEESGVRFIDSLLREDPNERQTSRQILDDDFLRPVADDGSSAHPSESVCFADRCRVLQLTASVLCSRNGTTDMRGKMFISTLRFPGG